MKLLATAVVLVIAAIGHFSSTHTVKRWQVRQATKLECGLAVTGLREDLVDRYCVTASGSAATSR